MKALFALLVLASAVNAYFMTGVQVVPQPQSITTGAKARAVAAAGLSLSLDFEDSVCGTECATIIKSGFDRVITAGFAAQTPYTRWKLSIHPEFDVEPPSAHTSGLAELATVSVTFDGTAANTLPEPGTWTVNDEYYKLTVGETGNVAITVKTAWGALRAFETLLQVCEWDDSTGKFSIGRLPLTIEDFPRFRWRGLMLDVVRHFIPMSKMKQLVDALAALKMNVLHLHLSDAQSFPLEIKAYPQLKNAQFGPKAAFTQAEMADFIAYARERGVMVIPESDIPGHTASWRYIDEDVVANCFEWLVNKHANYMENSAALNPANNKTYEAIDNIVKEMTGLFPSGFMHVGGDEVNSNCWAEATQANAINEYMAKNNFADYEALEKYMDIYAQKAVRSNAKRPIVWDECFQKGNINDANTIIHVWHSRELLQQAVKAGYDVVQSFGYYVDRQNPICSGTCQTNWMWSWTHRTFYETDLTDGLGLTAEEEAHVLGGLAASWEESVDDQNIDNRALSRTQSIAERLWSAADVTDAQSVELRSMRQRCLMVRRGISKAGPLSSDYCETSANQA